MREARRVPLLVSLGIALVGVALVGGWVVEHRGSAGGPEPISAFDAPNAHPQGPTSTTRMTPDDIAAGTIFIPSLAVYARLDPMGVSGGALEIPGDPGVVGWDEHTSPLDAPDGSSFLAGHVQAGGRNGALHDLPRVAPGSRVYTRDEAGELREWVVTTLRTSRDKVMEPEYFATTGERRLTVVTCTGPVVEKGGRRTFRDSAIVTAVPVPEEAVPH